MAHNRKPLYFRPSNPNIADVSQLANKLYQWDEVNSAPVEVQQGKAVMPPNSVENEFQIWSDTFTLGYSSEVDAAPIFFSDGGLGNDKQLEMINHIARRLNQPEFTDISTAKNWVTAQPDVHANSDVISVPAVTGLPWQLADCVLAFSALEPAGYDGAKLYNLSANNPGITMDVAGNPALVDNTIEFLPGQYAIGDYDAFTQILPNNANGTGNSNFTMISIFEGSGVDTRTMVFDMGFNVNLKTAFQFQNGGGFNDVIIDGDGIQTYFAQNGSHHQFAGDGANYNNAELNNKFIGKLGMLGFRATYQSGVDYMIEDILDGKPTAAWNPPPVIQSGQIGPINWTWKTDSWAKRRPVINASTSTGTPSTTGHTKFKGLYLYNRSLSDAEIQAIYDAHNI